MMSMKESRSQSADVAGALGADGGTSVQCFTIYIPDKDQQGNEIGNQRKWVLDALDLLGGINGGATAMPPCEGVWLNDDEQLIREQPVVVYSYIVPDAFLADLPRIRQFLHRLGRETNQGEVGFEFDGRFYRIRQFDLE